MFQKFIDGQSRSLLTRKNLILFSITALLFFAAYWFYSHAFVEIVIKNPSANSASYKITYQSNGKVAEVAEAPVKLKRLVRRGNHEVLVKQGESSHFSTVKVGGFMVTTKVETSLAPTKALRFIGDNPSSCMHYTGQILISHECNGRLEQLGAHQPANADQPTHVATYPLAQEEVIVGVVRGASDLPLIMLSSTPEEGRTLHALYDLKDYVTPVNPRELTELHPDKSYSIKPYKQGFLVYDEAFEHVLYYASKEAQPTSIQISKSYDETYELYSHDIKGKFIALAYTNVPEDALVGEGPKVKNASYEVNVIEENRVKNFKFKNNVSVKLCGTNKLCVLGSATRRLEIYDLSDKQQRPLYTVTGVESIESFGNNLLIVRDDAVLELDINKRVGFISYNLGDYKYCGLQTDDKGYTLCLIGNKDKKVALRINQQINKSDNIDKKVFDLLKMPELDDATIYDKFIHIFPKVDFSIFNPDTGLYEPDPAELNKTNAAINKKIKELNINQNTYRIINPYVAESLLAQ